MLHTFDYMTNESNTYFCYITFGYMTNESSGRLLSYNFCSPILSKVHLNFLSMTNESLYRLTKVIELTKVKVDFRKSYDFWAGDSTFVSDPLSGNKDGPHQWKYEPQRSEDMPKALDPRSGNMVLIRQTPAVEIKIGDSNGTHHQGHRRHPV